jgi:hypothetical protein
MLALHRTCGIVGAGLILAHPLTTSAADLFLVQEGLPDPHQARRRGRAGADSRFMAQPAPGWRPGLSALEVLLVRPGGDLCGGHGTQALASGL